MADIRPSKGKVVHKKTKMLHASIAAIEYFLPQTVVSSKDLAAEFPEWSVEKIDQKTGIQQRHIASPDECSSDLAEKAALALFAAGVVQPKDIDFILLCTQSPDYFLPTTACVLQHRLGIPTTAARMISTWLLGIRLRTGAGGRADRHRTSFKSFAADGGNIQQVYSPAR